MHNRTTKTKIIHKSALIQWADIQERNLTVFTKEMQLAKKGYAVVLLKWYPHEACKSYVTKDNNSIP